VKSSILPLINVTAVFGGYIIKYPFFVQMVQLHWDISAEGEDKGGEVVIV
jgi:hypothetical protein